MGLFRSGEGHLGQVGKDAEKLRVFISYSRDDLDFADQLDTALRYYGFASTLDRHGISGGEDWQRRLNNLIRDADTVAFVLSPASAKSEICAWEVDEAVRPGKRIIPVLCRPLDGASPPPQLRDLFFYSEPKSPGSGFGSGLERLGTALNTDLEWLRQHTRYLQRATEWDGGGRPANRLLSGSDITLAKEWAGRRPKDAPALTQLQLDFIRASEEWETQQRNEARRQLEERERLVAESEADQKGREAALNEAAAQSAAGGPPYAGVSRRGARLVPARGPFSFKAFGRPRMYCLQPKPNHTARGSWIVLNPMVAAIGRDPDDYRAGRRQRCKRQSRRR
jgi:hypothetical protein